MNDEINKPSHYMIFPDMEAIDIIRKTLTPEEFKGYLKGNSLKYRLRAGEKGPAEKCIAKAKVYEGWLYGAATKTLQEVVSGLGVGRTFEQKPWYPDYSGEWVEVFHGSSEMPHEIDGDEIVYCLTWKERDSKKYVPTKYAARDYDWESIVAYKKVNK